MKNSLLIVFFLVSLIGSAQGNQQDTLRVIDNYLTQLSSDKHFSGGLLIIRDGKKVFSKGYGWSNKEKQVPFTTHTLASIGSITKAFTATAIMKLVAAGKLSLDDPLSKFFPNVPADKSAITIHQLLTHSSGFHEFLKADGGDYEKLEEKEFLKRAFDEPLAFQPGTKGVYTNVGFSILGLIIEKVSGKGYEAFLREVLFAPEAIKGIGYHYPPVPGEDIAVGYQNGMPWGTHQSHFEQAGGGPYWNLKANGGLEASLDDMFLWINAMTRSTLLKQADIEKMFTPYIQEEGNGLPSWFGYGCNISKSRRNTTMIGNGGSNGIYFARIVRLPTEGLVFYMVTNESDMNTNMVLPNVTQLYFSGRIDQDGIATASRFGNQLSGRIYDLVQKPNVTDLSAELLKEKIEINDDMILLDAGQRLLEEEKFPSARLLYEYYTQSFPNIVVAWNDLGDVYRALHRKEDAIRCYREALRIRPGNQRAKENLEKLK